jgi:hypothetical protein
VERQQQTLSVFFRQSKQPATRSFGQNHGRQGGEKLSGHTESFFGLAVKSVLLSFYKKQKAFLIKTIIMPNHFIQNII